MEKAIGYSFDDEYVNKFCFDIENKKIEIHLTGYSDLLKNDRMNNPCIWVIEKWTDAKSKLCSEDSYSSLEYHLGIISMVLSIEIQEDYLKFTANMLDNRYVDLLFYKPLLKLLEL